MIAVAAYYLSEKRGFRGDHSIEDWLAAEQQVREVISPVLPTEIPMNDSNPKDRDAQAISQTSRPQKSPQQDGSRFEKYAATQAAGDGIEGDVLKPNKTTDDKISANMADRK